MAVSAAALLLATACGGGDGDGKKGGGSGDAAPGGDGRNAAPAVVAIAPGNKADDVATSGALKVTAEQGRLTSVTVKDAEGRAVPGRIAKNGAGWQPSEHLANDTTYTVEAVAENAAGRKATGRSTFTTVAAQDTFIGEFTPEDGSTVGAGMPVSLRFDHPITDRDAVEKAVRVTAQPPVPVEGHWFGDQRLDFRPEEYWAKGTKVTLKLRLRGVEGAEGVYGTQYKEVSFTVGRQQVSVVDAAKKTMEIARDGKVVKTLPITAGAPETTTYNGTMVISEKFEITRMNGATVDHAGEYDIHDVPHAMRLTTSGTFIHGNYWAGKSTFGSANVSHGCVGLWDHKGGGDNGSHGAWFYKNSLIGDVVVVKNSADKQVAPDNGLNGWNMPWSEWTAEQ
jgi:lipoprotein-anchoring transpeptidase ErfK/SrfK